MQTTPGEDVIGASAGSFEDAIKTRPPDSASPSETFVDVPDSLDVVSASVFDLLTQVLRDVDESQGRDFLLRYLTHPGELWARVQQKIWKLNKIVDYRRTAPALLHYLRHNVGFGGSPATEEIAGVLTESDLRKLISIAVAYLRRRGRRDALTDLVRAFTGRRPAVYDWLFLRSIVGETVLGFEGSPADPWLVAVTPEDIAPGDADGEIAVSIRVPLPASGWWSSGSRTRIVYDSGRRTGGYSRGGVTGTPSTDPRTDKDLILNLIDFARPVSERYEVAFVDWLDTFLDGKLGHWALITGSPSVWTPGEKGDPPVLPSLYLAPGCWEWIELVPRSPGWSQYVWSSIVRLEGPGSILRLSFSLFYEAPLWKGYFVDIRPDKVSLYRYGFPSPTLLAEAAVEVVPGVQYGIRIDTQYSGTDPNQTRIYLDNNLIIEDLTDSTRRSGSIGIASSGSATDGAFVGWSELFQRPVDVVILKGQGA